MNALPEAFVRRMRNALGKEYEDFLHALNSDPVRGIRMNRRKPFPGMEAYTSGERIPWTEDGYYLPPDSKAGATIFHEAGAFYLQEPAAMLPAAILDAHPGERILDLCAAPGGKSTQMALMMQGEGLIVCNEPVLKRAQILSRNLERMGIVNSVVTSSFPERLPHSWDGAFDAVMVDAPCSGEGMFRRDPATRNEWSTEQTAGCAARQREILKEASRFVRPGGRIVYSTCTYNPAENEENVGWFLREYPDFEAMPFSLPGIEGKDGMYLCLPHRIKGEGQFAALLHRKGNVRNSASFSSFADASKEEKCLYRSLLPEFPEPNARFGNNLIRIPECVELHGVRVLRAGLHLAEVRGKNLIPDHALAIAAPAKPDAPQELTAENAAGFIAGEEIEGQGSGWTIQRFAGLPIGWGKCSGGRIKNHYPKGLRKINILTRPE